MKNHSHRGGVSAVAVLLLLACRPARAPPPPSLSDIDFLRGDLVLCSGKRFGEVQFSLGCDASVREHFDLALSLLHSFQYVEAEKAFVRVIDTDADCTMAYWGVAMSIYHAAWVPPTEADLRKATQVLAVAERLKKTPKERAYLEAIGAYYRDWQAVEHAVRAKAYETRMAALHADYPADTEAAILYALALYSTRDREGKAYHNERKAGAILERLFLEQPNHPGIVHYIIYNYDNPTLAPLALDVARRYAAIAPGSPHA